MRVEWHGQSAFTLEGKETTVLIDPWDDVSSLAARGIQWDYPPIAAESVDLLLVTHEHIDHNGVGAVAGEPPTLRLAGSHPETPVGTVVGIASEHDEAAGSERGPNAIFVFELDGLRVCHFGDFGQVELRPEQRAAIGAVDLLFIPVGGGPTIGGTAAAEIASSLEPSWVVPMHYRTAKISFLESEEEFAAAFPRVMSFEASSFDTAELDKEERPVAVIPAAP
jgi:L-ascorbate metabolism protein UlaG (beta-lactamase superfamily)